MKYDYFFFFFRRQNNPTNVSSFWLFIKICTVAMVFSKKHNPGPHMTLRSISDIFATQDFYTCKPITGFNLWLQIDEQGYFGHFTR